jgi:hypothetical protein
MHVLIKKEGFSAIVVQKPKLFLLKGELESSKITHALEPGFISLAIGSETYQMKLLVTYLY